jgi:hypothetical protein
MLTLAEGLCQVWCLARQLTCTSGARAGLLSLGTPPGDLLLQQLQQLMHMQGPEFAYLACMITVNSLTEE